MVSYTKSNPDWPVSKANGLSRTKFLCLLGPEMDITGMWFLTLKSMWFFSSKHNPKLWVYAPCETVASRG